MINKKRLCFAFLLKDYARKQSDELGSLFEEFARENFGALHGKILNRAFPSAGLFNMFLTFKRAEDAAAALDLYKNNVPLWTSEARWAGFTCLSADYVPLNRSVCVADLPFTGRNQLPDELFQLFHSFCGGDNKAKTYLNEKGVMFLHYDTPEAAAAAVEKIDGLVFDAAIKDRPMFADFALDEQDEIASKQSPAPAPPAPAVTEEENPRRRRHRGRRGGVGRPRRLRDPAPAAPAAAPKPVAAAAPAPGPASAARKARVVVLSPDSKPMAPLPLPPGQHRTVIATAQAALARVEHPFSFTPISFLGPPPGLHPASAAASSSIGTSNSGQWAEACGQPMQFGATPQHPVPTMIQSPMAVPSFSFNFPTIASHFTSNTPAEAPPLPHKIPKLTINDGVENVVEWIFAQGLTIFSNNMLIHLVREGFIDGRAFSRIKTVDDLQHTLHVSLVPCDYLALREVWDERFAS